MDATAPMYPPPTMVPRPPVPMVDAPLSPRVKVLIVALRRALLIIYDGLGEYAGIEKERAAR